MSHRTQGILFLLGAALCWSLGGLLIKLVDLEPLGLAGARSGIAAIMIWLYLRYYADFFSSPDLPENQGDRSLSFLARHRTVILGALTYAATVILFVLATKQTTAANAILLQYTAPVWVALLSPLFLRERTSGLDWIAVILTFGGMSLFFMDNVATTARTGDLLAILSGLFFALCIITLRKGRDGLAVQMVLYGNIVAAIIGLPFLIGHPLHTEDILPLLALGIGQLGLGYLLFARGIAYVTAVEGALIPVIEPILNPLWVALAIGEYPSRWGLIGGLIVLAVITGRGVLKSIKREN